VFHILAGRSNTVNSRTAAAILDLEPYRDPDPLDVQPLAAAIEATGRPLTELLPDVADRRGYYRALRAGVISEPLADRLAIRALSQPLELIYNFEVSA
jgi:hypothetical protein